jgi:hypothetical protein
MPAVAAVRFFDLSLPCREWLVSERLVIRSLVAAVVRDRLLRCFLSCHNADTKPITEQ